MWMSFDVACMSMYVYIRHMFGLAMSPSVSQSSHKVPFRVLVLTGGWFSFTGQFCFDWGQQKKFCFLQTPYEHLFNPVHLWANSTLFSLSHTTVPKELPETHFSLWKICVETFFSFWIKYFQFMWVCLHFVKPKYKSTKETPFHKMRNSTSLA